MPALDSIVGVKEIERGGKTFRIIKTTEMDDYDEPASDEPSKPTPASTAPPKPAPSMRRKSRR
jgi:hypothetical protein